MNTVKTLKKSLKHAYYTFDFYEFFISKNRIQIEADMVVHGVEQVDLDTVKLYGQDLQSLIVEAGITERKVFLQSFIRRIEINGDRAAINYLLPLSQDKKGRAS
jgi:hypothetical protein